MTPVLLSFFATLAHCLPGEESTHRTLAAIVATLGAVALVRGFRVHGKRRVLVWMAAGLGCIFLAAWFGERLPSHLWEVSLTMMGSSLMILAHRRNHTFCRDCKACTHA
ncbi:MerC domain-containing protein [Terriglobus sp. RCC_193]